MPEKGWVNVGIPEEIAEIIDKVIDNHKTGARSRADLVLEATKRLLRELGEYPPKPRFEHYNIYDDHATVIDNQTGEWINVYFRDNKLGCDFCKKSDCEHIRFLLDEDDFRRRLGEKGFKLPE